MRCLDTMKVTEILRLREMELNLRDIADAVGCSKMTRQCLNRRIDNIVDLRSELGAWENERNKQQATVNWQFRTADARIKLSSLYPAL